MTYLDSNTRTVKTPASDQFRQLGRSSSLFGVFAGFIKQSDDVQRNGRLKVWIPEFGSAPEDDGAWTIVNYCSPFAGATNVDTISKSDKQTFDGTQTSYGMWMIPPDINNIVLVMFINGDPSRGIWIGCLYNQYMNNMVPGMAASASNWQYPGKKIPVAEYNKWDKKVTQPDSAIKPYEKTKFSGVGNQGLITDEGRGVTSSSARRESPSNVFGIVTPGPAIKDDKFENIRRKGGSSFIMDDGIGSEYVEFATKTGAKVRIDETNGFIYMINRDGTAWIQMDKTGNLDVFSQFDISLRSMRDVNIRADRNLNMEAGQNVYLSAAKDTKLEGSKPITYDINDKSLSLDVPWYKKYARGTGDGGNIVIEAQYDMHTTVVQNNLYVTTLGTLEHSTTAGLQSFKARRDINIETDANYNLKVNATIFDPPTPSGEIKIYAGHDMSLKVANISDPDFTYKGKIALDSVIYGLKAEKEIISTSTGDKFYVGCDVDVSATVSSNLFVGPINVDTGTISTPPPTDISAADAAKKAEMKALGSAMDILPLIKEPFFTRSSQDWQTIIERWPTYEPCPLHEEFKFESTAGYTPTRTAGDDTYNGSPGGGAATSPPPNTDRGANNTEIPPPDNRISPLTKDMNLKAFECQLKIHEGVKYVSYNDSLGLPTAGIGHLLRADEIAKYPIGTPVSSEQVSRWFQQDSSTSIKDAENFVGIDTWAKLDDNRKRALSDLAYNMGGPRLNKFTSFRSAMQKGDYNAAGVSLSNSKWATQVGNRAPKVISQIVNGVDPNGCDKKFPP